MEINNGRINLTSDCNAGCHCDGFSYTPVCWEETGDTFFSPCTAHCNAYSKEKKVGIQALIAVMQLIFLFQYYHECECAREVLQSSFVTTTFVPTLPLSVPTSSPEYSTTFSTSQAPTTKLLEPTSFSPSQATTTKLLEPTQPTTVLSVKNVLEVRPPTAKVPDPSPANNDDSEYYDDDTLDDKPGRSKRSKEKPQVPWGKLVPGACIKGCAFGFYAFSIVGSIINCFGASGRIGNLLVNYRCVSKQDKSVTQGLILMMISLFALIPGPILFGRIIDSTCLVWTEQCSGRRGNCQLYDQRLFRYYINLTACFFTAIGVFFDFLVWKNGKNLDLYGEREEEMLKKQQLDSRNGRSQT